MLEVGIYLNLTLIVLHTKPHAHANETEKYVVSLSLFVPFAPFTASQIRGKSAVFFFLAVTCSFLSKLLSLILGLHLVGLNFMFVPTLLQVACAGARPCSTTTLVRLNLELAA